MASLWKKLKSKFKSKQLTAENEQKQSNQTENQTISPAEAEEEVWIRDIPVIDSKYKHIWQRSFARIRAQNMLARMTGDLMLYGTDEAESYVIRNSSQEENSKGSPNKRKILKKRTTKLVNPEEIDDNQERLGCLFAPNGKVTKTWNVVLIILLLYTAIIMPYRISFVEFVWYDDWFYVELVVDALFFTDFLVNLNSAYRVEDDVLVTSRKTIFCTYLQGWMMLDIIAMIPFNLIDSALSGEQNTSSRYNSMVRLLRLPRLYRLVKFSKLLKVLKMSKTPWLNKLQEFFHVRQSAVRSLAIMFTTWIITHIIAWMWYFTARVEDFGPDTWVVRAGLQDDSNTDKYIACIYWTFATMATVGYGDISSGTGLEMILAITVMLFGVWFFSFTIGSLSSTFSRIDSREARLTKKIQLLDEFAIEADLEKDLAIRLRHALQYSSEKTGFSWAEWREIFNELPKKLKYEVAMVMHQGAAKYIPFFRGRDMMFISTVVPFLQPMLFYQQQIVYYKDEHADEIYFVAKGRIVFIYKDVVFQSQPKGSYFGEIEVLRQIPRKFSVSTLSECNLLILKRELILVILENFFSIGQELQDVATMRERLYKKQRQKALSQIQSTHIQFKKQTRQISMPLMKSQKNIGDLCEQIAQQQAKLLEIEAKIDEKITLNDQKIQRMQNTLWDTSELVDKTSAGVPIRPLSHNQFKLPPLGAVPNISPIVNEPITSEEVEVVPTFRNPNWNQGNEREDNTTERSFK